MKRHIAIAVVLLSFGAIIGSISCATKSDVSPVIKAEEMTNIGGNWDVPVELTPSDSIELDKVYSVELLSTEGYSFGRELVYWDKGNARSIQTVTFQIPAGDKVASQLENAEQEVWVKLFESKNPAKATELYRAAVGEILKVSIKKGELATVQGIRTEQDPNLSPVGYQVILKLLPTKLVKAKEVCIVVLTWTVGNEKPRFVDEVSWSESEIDAGKVKEVSFGGISKSYADRVLGSGSNDFWEHHDYSVQVLPSGVSD